MLKGAAHTPLPPAPVFLPACNLHLHLLLLPPRMRLDVAPRQCRTPTPAPFPPPSSPSRAAPSLAGGVGCRWTLRALSGACSRARPSSSRATTWRTCSWSTRRVRRLTVVGWQLVAGPVGGWVRTAAPSLPPSPDAAAACDLVRCAAGLPGRARTHMAAATSTARTPLSNSVGTCSLPPPSLTHTPPKGTTALPPTAPDALPLPARAARAPSRPPRPPPVARCRRARALLQL